ncbi:MAG: DCC1-like thiol-disulfide oxidoreductase family protein [Albidovulum sp.]|uniref:thiol-disulfide oxidoreductase DCC family protein n=1 Tax=Albidovulum sp. TaxID=1872424 RepID=UPI003CA1BD8E
MHPYSYRDDATVPAFDDAAPVAFMDGECVLCAFGARMIDRLDRRGDIRICPVATPLGQAMLRHYGLTPGDPESWLFLEAGRVWRDFDAMARVGARSGGMGHLLRLLLVIPKPLRDWLYTRIARNRYALFGRTDLCALAPPSLRARLLT